MAGPEEKNALRRRAGSLDALRAITHVTRLRIWAVLGGGPASAAELARHLDLQHAAASYHLRVLRDAGLVVLADERTVNGGTERRYRMITPPDEPLDSDQPMSTQAWIALVAVSGALQRQRAARVAMQPKWFDDVEVWVPPEALVQARQHLDSAFGHLRGAAVPPGTPGTVPLSASALLFPMRPPGGSPDSAAVDGVEGTAGG